MTIDDEAKEVSVRIVALAFHSLCLPLETGVKLHVSMIKLLTGNSLLTP